MTHPPLPPVHLLGYITPSAQQDYAQGKFAFDGSINSFWNGKSTTAYIVYDAGRPRVALSYKIATRQTGCPRQWQFQGSDNFDEPATKRTFDIIDSRMHGICNRARFAHYAITSQLEVIPPPIFELSKMNLQSECTCKDGLPS